MLLRRTGDFWPKRPCSQKVGHSRGRDNGVEIICITSYLSPPLVPPHQKCRSPLQEQRGLSPTEVCSHWVLPLETASSNGPEERLKFCFNFYIVKVYLGLSQSPTAPLKASRVENLLQVTVHLLEKKTEQLTSGGACFALKSSGTQVVARTWKAESHLWPLFSGPTTWRAHFRFYLGQGLRTEIL